MITGRRDLFAALGIWFKSPKSTVLTRRGDFSASPVATTLSQPPPMNPRP